MISIRTLRLSLALAAAVLASVPAAAQPPASTGDRPALEMRPCELPGGRGMARCGTYWPLENREQPGGRRIPVDVVVIPARSATPRPDPVFFAYGGPGQTATQGARDWIGSAMNEARDIVLVDQRGTSPAHALDCRLSGSPDNPQGYLEPIFSAGLFRRCRAELETKADLTRYTTADYVDDLDDVRRALGYGQINIQGGSYGSRVVLFYLRRYPRNARTAFMDGVDPAATMRNPLYHAQDSQAALDSVFNLCAREAGCARTFPNLRREFGETMDRLRRRPASVRVPHPATGAPLRLTLDANAFAEGVRVMMYDWNRSRRLPLLLHRAHRGDYAPFAEAALRYNAALRDIRMGLAMSTLCYEDLSRITEADIVAETRGTFLGDLRVRTQKAACAEWPRRATPAGVDEPVVSDVPALLVSGAYDPATAPRWGTLAARTLPNSLHVIIPAAHTAGSRCVDRIRGEFLDRGTVQGLDTSCVGEMRLAPFVLSEGNGRRN